MFTRAGKKSFFFAKKEIESFSPNTVGVQEYLCVCHWCAAGKIFYSSESKQTAYRREGNIGEAPSDDIIICKAFRLSRIFRM
jgi:hypothetical protein